jgi:hypothetical protein
VKNLGVAGGSGSGAGNEEKRGGSMVDKEAIERQQQRGAACKSAAAAAMQEDPDMNEHQLGNGSSVAIAFGECITSITHLVHLDDHASVLCWGNLCQVRWHHNG